jgi:hypothetical protein
MGSPPKIVPNIRAEAVLPAAGAEEGHRFVSAGFDEGVFLLHYRPREVGAVLNVRLSFAKSKTEDVASGTWYKQMHAPDDATSALESKSYTYTSTIDNGYEDIALSLPLMDKAVRIEVWEVSTVKGDLAIDAVGTSLGQH